MSTTDNDEDKWGVPVRADVSRINSLAKLAAVAKSGIEKTSD
jgi:hypothetical protein